MTALLVLLVLIAVIAIAASVHLVLTDGYGPIPDHSPAPRRRRRTGDATDVLGSRYQSLGHSGPDWNRDSRTLQTR